MNRTSVKRRNRKISQRRNRTFIAITSLLVAIVISINANQGLALGNDNAPIIDTHYVSIEIEPGENLWSIATRYKAEEQSVSSYIAELKQMNNFDSNDIREGDYLIVTDYTL